LTVVRDLPLLVAVVACATALMAASPSAASAQRIFGAVVLADSTSPAAGAIVTATDSAGVAGERELTSGRGDFVLPVAHPGRYTVTVLRIGSLPEVVRDVIVEPGRDRRIRIVITRDAPRPPAMQLRSGEQCNVLNENSIVAHAWSQFQVALSTAEMAGASKAFSATWLRSERVLARNLKDTLGRSDKIETSDLESAVMAALPPDSARLAGFVIETEAGVQYHVPDVATLLSRSFSAKRCFAFEPAPPGQPDWIGLHFRSPDFRIGVSDIEGTIWMDRATLEPRGLGYRYSNLPPAFNPAEAGGTLRFRRLPTGHWIVEEWTVRVPSGAFRRIYSYDIRGAPSGFATALTLDGVRMVTVRLMELEMNGSPIFRRQ
jgi:hypothetical protein